MLFCGFGISGVDHTDSITKYHLGSAFFTIYKSTNEAQL